MWRSSWRRKRLKPIRILGWTMMTAGAAAIIGSFAVNETSGIPGWEPANHVIQEAMAQETAAKTETEAVVAASPAAAGADALPQPASASKEAEPEIPPPEASASETAQSPLLDLNTATEAELDALPGIGPAKAKAIIAYRESGRPFRSVDDLLQVKGIGPKLLEQIRPFVRAGSSQGA